MLSYCSNQYSSKILEANAYAEWEINPNKYRFYYVERGRRVYPKYFQHTFVHFDEIVDSVADRIPTTITAQIDQLITVHNRHRIFEYVVENVYEQGRESASKSDARKNEIERGTYFWL